jgi:hypothetical protein
LILREWVTEYVDPTGLTDDWVRTTQYYYDRTTGNLDWEQEYENRARVRVEYRYTDYDYVMNMNPSVWILNTLSCQTLRAGGSAGAILSQQEYGYDGNLPGYGTPTHNKPTLSRVVNDTQTIDTEYVYDPIYGNLTVRFPRKSGDLEKTKYT